MLAYRHAFHAGNHADVLKHLILARVLKHLGEKDKPYLLLDTHAGAGSYRLNDRLVREHGESTSGVEALLRPAAAGASAKPLPEALAGYLALVREFNGPGPVRRYPGSPALAAALMRSTDELRLYELHPSDHRRLAAELGARPHTQVYRADGFGAFQRDLPPPSRRGAVLMDPPYEIKTDYVRVVNGLREGLKRFAEGTFLIWYPQLQTVESRELPRRLKATAETEAPRGWLHAAITVAQADERGYGMLGSGMFVVNPPHTLFDELRPVMPLLVQTLGQFKGARHLLDRKAV